MVCLGGEIESSGVCRLFWWWQLFSRYVEAAYKKAAMENGFEEEHMRIKNLPS